MVLNITKERNKPHLLSLLHYLYEAQDPSLCESVVQQCQQGLDLSNITRTPSDYLIYALDTLCLMLVRWLLASLKSLSRTAALMTGNLPWT